MSLTARAIRYLEKRRVFFDAHGDIDPVVYDCQELASSFPDIVKPRIDQDRHIDCVNKALCPVIDAYKLKDPESPIELPYPSISLQFELEDGIKEIVIVKQKSEHSFYLNVILFDPEDGIFRPSMLTGERLYGNTGMFLNQFGETKIKAGEIKLEEAMDIQKNFIYNASFLTEFLCTALSLSVVKAPVTRQGVSKAQNEKRKRRKKRKLFQERKVVIYVPRETHAPVEHQGGTHASPCPHLRSGHWRRLKSGKQTWVRQCQVGKGPIPETTYEIRTRH